MANPPQGGSLHKIDFNHELGKSTLVGNLNMSIPMPPGATPPPNPSAQAQAKPTSNGSPSGGQGAKSNG